MKLSLPFLLILLAFTLLGACRKSTPATPVVLDPVISIEVAPQSLNPGEQAILLITSRFQKGHSQAVKLKDLPADAGIKAEQLINNDDWSRERTPDSSSTQVYRLTLTADSYDLKASDFTNLPPGFQLPTLILRRMKPISQIIRTLP